MAKDSIVKQLQRDDKWYLGAGGRLIWAPPFPVWLEYPGFWDKAHYYNREIEPLFTWALLDDEGNELSLKAEQRVWNPAVLTTVFACAKNAKHQPESVKVTERKCCLPDDTLASEIEIKNSSAKPRTFHLIAWSVQPTYPEKRTTWIEYIEQRKNEIHFKKYLASPHPDLQCMPVTCSFGLDQEIVSYSINLSEGSVLQPHWKFTPFKEKFRAGKLPDERKCSGVTEEGLLYIALHCRLKIGAGKSKRVTGAFSVASSERKTKIRAIKKNLPALSAKQWDEYFSTMPHFECSDKYLTKYYYYRWYGLRLNTIDANDGNYRYPAVCEGIGYFRAPISYSAVCHVRENRWRTTPRLAQGSVLTFLHNQRKDGGFRGYIDVDGFRQEMFYHADWGKAITELHAIQPDIKFLKTIYPGFVRYVEYFDRERDAERSGLYDIDNHYETGQEYMHRYTAVNPDADREHWGEVFRLKGVDVTVYVYELKRALQKIALLLNRRKEAERWREGAEFIKNAVRTTMWNNDVQMFFDVNPETGKQTHVKATTCFYPYMTDIVTFDHIAGLKKHVFNPDEFWTPFPIPSSSVDDEYFHSEAEWKRKRMNCPWNGRVWPMTNSHIVEVLAQSALRFEDKELRERCAQFIVQFVRMMFFDGDVEKPNCLEHYNPFTGEPSYYRGVDDYQHSWVADLILKYIAGIRLTENAIVIDPFPISLDSFVLKNMRIRKKSITVKKAFGKVTVFVSGKKIAESTVGGTPIHLNL